MPEPSRTLSPMTWLCVPITVISAEQAHREARAAQLAGAALIEYRVDGCFDPEDDFSKVIIADVVKQAPSPCIVTCRIASEGGEFHGDDADRAALFHMLAELDHPPHYIDIELAALESSAALRDVVRRIISRRHSGASAPRVIVSIHDFDKRPADLVRRLERLRQLEEAAIIKVAYRTRSLRDNLELFEMLRTRDRPTMALGMGEFGLLSRVLAPKFGGFLTFVALNDQSATAPGQPTLHEVQSLYRIESITRTTRVYGVIGWPVKQSLSPQIHNAGFESIDFDGVYLPLPVPPEWEHFKATMTALTDDPHLDFSGASVTIPHKEHLVRLARERESDGWTTDPISAIAGAANTLSRDGDHWRVINTDAPAIVECLRARVGALRDQRVLIIGAGGVARAAAAGMAQEGARVFIHNRTAERAQALVNDFAPIVGVAIMPTVVAAEELRSVSPRIVINATSVGMAGGDAASESPIDLAALTPAPEGLVVFDTVYQPRVTPLLAQAEALGHAVIPGAEMFVRQAALQFEAWTGSPAPQSLFQRIVDEKSS